MTATFGPRAETPEASGNGRVGTVDGATFALDAPTRIEAVWGAGTSVLWAEGEPTMLYGPDGVGKTTLAQQLVRSRIGIGAAELLGYSVAASKVLYLALDRPKQAARSMRRMVSEDDRELLRERLVVWRGSLPFDVIRSPDSLAEFVQGHDGVGTVVIDSLKDFAPKLSEEDTGMAVHRAWQLCVERGIEVLSLHHPRKAQAENKRPRALADVYGSRWLTAGCGSVLLLWGEAGDPVVELEHLKQPADTVGPLTLLHDSHRGTTTVINTNDVVGIIEVHPDRTATVHDVAKALFRGKEGRNEIEKARRRCDAALAEGRLEKLDADPGFPVRYRLTPGVTRGGHGGSREGVTGEGHGAPYVVGARDPRSRSRSRTVTCVCADGGAERTLDGRCGRCFGCLP